MFNCHFKAERVGFEPTVELPPLRFSRPACSTAPAPLRKRIAELLLYVNAIDLRIAARVRSVLLSCLGSHSKGNEMKRATKAATKLMVLENDDPISAETQ